jgi:hypothetical protein
MNQGAPSSVWPEAEPDDWAAGIAQIWMPDWNDPREDIYTLEDGSPVDSAK